MILAEHRLEFLALADKYNYDTSFLYSIIFPELVCFSETSNFLESAGEDLLYVSLGSEYVDFSIGYFQMKPSFFEKIDSIVENNKNFHYLLDLIKYDSNSSRNVKTKRSCTLNRLKDILWQFKYLICFCKIVDGIFIGKSWKDSEEKIRTVSTIYNSGLFPDTSEENVRLFMQKKFFPYGNRYKRLNFNYSMLSYIYYSKSCFQ